MAHGIGGRTVKELNEGPDASSDGMDVEEFLTWAAYLALEPVHADRADVHIAMLMAQQYNMNRGKGKAAKKPRAFLPQWYKAPKQEMTTEQMGHAMRLQYLAWGGDPKAL